MHPFNRDLVDPSVTEEEIEQAEQDPAGDYPDSDEQDDLDELGAGRITPATPHQAVLNARALRDHHTFVGIGYCLRTVRGPIFKLSALWPDANSALKHGKPIHRVADVVNIPRGAVIGFHNATHGHITLGLGGGLNSTTDYHEPGFEGVASIARTADWCNADRVVWYETLNGFDVWPDPVKKPATPAPWTPLQRLTALRREQAEAKKAGQWQRATRFDQWADRIEKRLEGRK